MGTEGEPEARDFEAVSKGNRFLLFSDMFSLPCFYISSSTFQIPTF